VDRLPEDRLVNHPSGPDDALSRDDVRVAYEDDPTWALLRSYNSRWMLPLFSRHLEHAEGPVSADWFHQQVAQALDQQSLPDRADDARLADDASRADHASRADDAAEEARVGSPVLGPVPEGRTTPADYCRGWVDSRWLIRTRASSADGDRPDDGGHAEGATGDRRQAPVPRGEARAQYRLSPYALKALRIVRELVEHDNAVSEARLGSIAHAVGQLAGLADPSREAQTARIDEQIAELHRRRDRIEQHGTEPVSPDVLKRQVREVVRLTASLPEDFRQLSSMVEQRHREVARRATVEHVGKGALVEQYLRENDLLEQTPEGRAYRGFAQMLSSREIDVMRADIELILDHPAAAEHLTERQRTQLESLISSLLAEEQSVQETYGRWTSSLRRFLSRSSTERHQRLLTLADRALHAGGVWAERRPGPAVLPVDVLGLGALDVVDISQAQLHSDRGRPTVDVQVPEGDATLPAADRAALRLTSGTSTAAVAATLERLLDRHETVTSAELYEATDPEFRRLGLVLSMLDLAIDQGVVDESTETVTLTSADDAGGADRQVVLPRLVFRRPPARDDDAPASTPQSERDPA
jgi:hypothetical protein